MVDQEEIKTLQAEVLMVYDVDKDRWWGKEAYNGKRKGFRFSWLRIEDVNKAMNWARKLGQYTPQRYQIYLVACDGAFRFTLFSGSKGRLIDALY